MHISKIILKNFRNYEKLDLDLNEGTNLIYGLNGQGKTNIIEAIYFFAACRSHRTNHEKDLIKYNMPFAEAEIFFENSERDMSAKIRLFPNDRHYMEVNGVRILKNSELIGNFNAVLFSPEDFSIIKDGPSERRRFTDIAISQVKKSYFDCLVNYSKVLKQKNKLLKEEKAFNTITEIYNEQLADFGSKIIFHRNKFYEFIKEASVKIYREITLSTDKFEIKYDSCVKIQELSKMKKELLAKLESLKTKEMFERTSIFGPHREDVRFFINGKDVRDFASQGQQRTVILVLKLAFAEFIREIRGEYPVLLLDDILSELDSYRRKYLLEEIRDKQVIITSTDKGSFGRRKNTKLIHIENAQVID